MSVQVTDIKIVYGQYGHLTAANVTVKNAGDKMAKANVTVQVARVIGKGRFGKKEEKGVCGPVSVDLAPGAEHTIEMVFPSAVLVGREFTISVTCVVEEAAEQAG